MRPSGRRCGEDPVGTIQHMLQDPGATRTGRAPQRVVVVDDDLLTLDLLQKVVSRHEDFEVVGTASDGRSAVALCEELLPDLVLMDIVMPEHSGIDAIREISAACPSVRCLALTAVTRTDVLFEAIRAGACGYLLKAAPAAELYHAMQGALAGRSVCSISAETIRSAADAQPLSDPDLLSHLAAPLHASSRLTSRQLDIVRQLAAGYSNREIGENLFISEATVKAYLGTLCRTFGVRDRLQLLIRCQELGLVWPSLSGASRGGDASLSSGGA